MEQFGDEWEKEMMKWNKKQRIAQIRSEWVEKNNLPLGEQKAPVLVGRMKTGNVTLQADGKYVEIPKQWLRETAFSIISCMEDVK